jgi:LysM repeat protein
LLGAQIKRSLALLLLFLLAGCGQVITLPTATAVPPTPTIEMTVGATPRPTATPAPYTPAPTSTATATPTPIFYTIKGGDTLLAIAQEYGVTVAALQETNGIVDPRALRVNQEIVIPHKEESEDEGAEPTPTPTPMPFDIGSLHFERTPLGGLWCLGEMHNSSTVALEQLQVQVTLYDVEHEPLVTSSAFVQLDLVEPDARSPFAVLFPEAPASFASYEARPLGAVPAFLDSFYRDLEVRDVEVEGERYASYVVSGRVVNVGPEDAVGVSLVVTAYDVLGQVIGVRKAVPEHNVVHRGGETTFLVDFVPAGGPVVTTTVQVLGQRLLPTPSATP